MKLHEYIQVSSRRGHFNFCDPSQESISTHIAIVNPDGSKKMYCNIKTDRELDNSDDIVYEIDAWLKRILYATDQEMAKTIRDYIVSHEEDLWIGGLQKEREKLMGKRDDLNTRLSVIDKQLSGFGYFEKGVWVEP
jgi:hypothetical protein